MRVHVRSVLDCPAELVWAEVQTTRLLLTIIRPLLRFVPLRGSPLPERWQAGNTTVGRAYALGVVPLGPHRIWHESIDHTRRQILSREQDRWIRRWDHLISVSDAGDGRTLYSDAIEIEAGLLTLVVWLFAQWFYRHRQRRWRRVARRLSAAAASAERMQAGDPLRDVNADREFKS